MCIELIQTGVTSWREDQRGMKGNFKNAVTNMYLGL